MPSVPYEKTERSVPTRGLKRASYDRELVHAILDDGYVCHLGFVRDGAPVVLPTLYARVGERLYVHGSTGSRPLLGAGPGLAVCLTVTHLDGIVLARSAFHHSVNYRSVLAFGRARLVSDPAEKRRAIDGFVDRFFPGRSAELRPPTAQEIKATSFVVMEIEEAAAKIRSSHVSDDEEDYGFPCWAAVLPISQVLGEADECPRQLAGLARPPGVAGYAAGRKLEDALFEAYRRGAYDSETSR